MAISDKVKAMLNLRGKKILDLAKHFEMSPQAMRNKLSRESFSAEDLIRISMFLDSELSFRILENQIITLDQNDLRENIGAAEEIKKFKRLDKRIDSLRQDKQFRGEFPINERGVMVIPPVSDDDKPKDISEEDWGRYMQWKFSKE